MTSISFLLLSEDSSEGARLVLWALLKKWLYLLDPACQPDCLTQEPTTEPAKKAMIFNGWTERTGKGHRKQIDLATAILNQVLPQDAERFVLWHMDGDRRWSESADGADAKYLALYQELILPRLTLVLQHRGAADRLQRLIIVMPYYSMEAWLYQNFAELRRIYQERHKAGHPDLARIAAWEAQPGSIEEELQIKDQLTLGSSHNTRLAAGSFPAARIASTCRSFAKALQDLRARGALQAALAQIRRG